jgi:dihydroorotate dehydrogenase (fumarate)
MHPHETADAIEDDLVATVEELNRLVSIPIAVKLTPYFTSLPHLTARLVGAGAAGIVLFGRYPEPDIDLGRSGIEVRWPLTRPSDIGHTLRWVGLLRPHLHPHSLAACGGVENSEDALKMLMAGADVVMIASVLYRHGPDAVRSILDGMRQWASHSGSDTLRDWVGAKVKVLNAYPQATERAEMTGSLLHAAEHTADEEGVE